MQDSETSSVDAEHPRLWSWLKSPWWLLIIGGVTALLLWVGCGAWIEHRRALALAELEASPGIEVDILGVGRYPVWMPVWLGNQTHEVWDSRIVDQPLFVNVLEPLTERQSSLLVRLPSIYHITFSDGSYVSDEALLTLCETQHFGVLEFGRPRQLTHRHYEALARNPNLNELSQIKGPFDQAAVQTLEQMQQLTQLELVGALSDTVRATGLSRLPHLYYLAWHDSQLTDEQFSDLAGSPSVTTLKLYKTQLTRRSWAALASMHVDFLHLESPHIDDRLADELARNFKITNLKLRGGQFSDQALRTFLESGRREFVDTQTEDVSLDTAQIIGNTPSLACLAIRGSRQINDEILKAMVHEQLSELSILNSSITDAGVEHLRLCSGLRSVGLANSRITDRSLKVLSELKTIHRLDLRNTTITDDGLRQYYLTTDLMSLQRLHLGGTQVSAAAVKEFQQKHSKVVVHGVEGSEADDRAEVWFRSLDVSDGP